MVSVEFKRVEESLREKLDNRLILLEDLKRRSEENEGLDDVDLRLHMKNWYFGYHGRGCAWPPTNFEHFDEFKDDPVMQELVRVYKGLRRCEDRLRFGEQYDDYRGKIREVSLGLSELATHMANRSLNGEDYLSLVDRTHPALQKAYGLFPVLVV